MDPDAIIRLCQAALWIVLVIVTPVVVVSAGVGLLVAVIETLTSVQEQTIGTAARLIAVLVLLLVFGGAAGSAIHRFAQEQFGAIVQVGRS
ncbi:MAG: SctS: non flagellar system conserved transrane protein [Pseudomonadota bacterium]|jgi:type III secretion protein S